MYLYENYCYGTLEDVGNTILSAPILGDGSVIQTVSNNSVDLTVTTTSTVFTIHPASCSEVGPVSSLGITFAEGQELTWFVVLILVIGFAWKQMGKTL